MFEAIQNNIIISWKSQILACLGCHFQLSTVNTSVLQGLLRSPDHRWRHFVTKMHQFTQFPLFNSASNVKKLRKIVQPRTHFIGRTVLRCESSNQYAPLKQREFWISMIEETEIINQCFDNLINNNNFIKLTQKFGDKQKVQCGFDKATKGGLNVTWAMAGVLFTVQQSMCSMFIPGVFIPAFELHFLYIVWI